MALLDTPSPSPQSPITADQAKAKLRTGHYDDTAALALVCQDALRAESFEQAKSWVAAWPQSSTLYQSPFVSRTWDDGRTEKASIPFFTVASAVNTLVPQIINGMFYENPPFMIQERPGTKVDDARAVSAILAYQLEDINFKEELRLGAMNAVLFGTALWKYGWESLTKKRKIYHRKPGASTSNPVPGGPNIQIHNGEIEEEVVEEHIERPTFEHMVNLRYVLVDPTLNVPDIRQAKYVIHRMYPTWDDLDALRDRPGFNIPSREKLLELFLPPKEPVEAAVAEAGVKNPQWDLRAENRYEEATVDPFNEPLEILERWDNETYIVVLQKKLVICNDDNPYGQIPFLSVGWWDVPEAFWSMGLAKTIGSEQRLQQGITNIWLDNAALNLNGVYIRKMGSNVPTQSIRISPGKIVNIEKEGEFEPLKRLDPVPEAGEHISLSQNRVDQLSGAGALNTSGMGAGHSNLARSATGANLIGSSSTTAPDFVEKLSNQVIIPFLYAAHEMNSSLMPEERLHFILNDELQHEYIKSGRDIVNILNARVKFSILASANMQSRKQMAAQLPIIIQFLTNQQTTDQLAIAGYRVDVVQLMRDMYEASDWKDANDVIVKMTPEEQQRAQMNSPAAKQAMQIQAQQQQQQQQHSDKLEIVDAENQARAGREVLRHALEASETPQVLTGEAGKSQSFTQ